jgi:8-oxo-dGTP pyrophosphatase MutT (NUDIX family)
MRKAVTAGGVVLRKLNGKIEMLLVYNSDFKFWSMPKGHINPGETIEESALREVREETGLAELEIIKKLGIITRDSMEFNKDIVKKDIHIFVFKTDSKETPKPSDREIGKTGWFGIDRGVSVIHFKEDREFLQKHKDELNFK